MKPAEVEETSRQGFGPPQAVVYGLTYGDIDTIRMSIPGVTNVIASRIVKKNVWNLGYNMNTDVVGTAVDYPVSRNYNLRSGRFFSESEVRDHSNVVVLSDEVASELFPIDNPLGQTIKIDSDYYNILGIMESEGFSNLGQNQAGRSLGSPYLAPTRFPCIGLQVGRSPLSTRLRLSSGTKEVPQGPCDTGGTVT